MLHLDVVASTVTVVLRIWVALAVAPDVVERGEQGLWPVAQGTQHEDRLRAVALGRSGECRGAGRRDGLALAEAAALPQDLVALRDVLDSQTRGFGPVLHLVIDLAAHADLLRARAYCESGTASTLDGVG